MTARTVSAFAERIPMLQAEEALLAVNVACVGSGSAEKGAGERWTQDLQRAANRGRGIARRAASREEHLQTLRMMGVDVEIVDRPVVRDL